MDIKIYDKATLLLSRIRIYKTNIDSVRDDNFGAFNHSYLSYDAHKKISDIMTEDMQSKLEQLKKELEEL